MGIAIFLFVIGAFAVAAGFNMLGITRKAQGWPQVPGRVIERGVGEATTTGASRAGRYFEPRVKYTYSVAGKDYTGARIDFNNSGYNKDTAQKVADALPESLPVSYDPQNPAESVLKPGSAAVPGLVIGLGAILALAGAATLLSALSKRG